MHSKIKVVVLGGSGFIGSNICSRLLNKGHEVICIDNLSTGSKSNMMEFLFNPLFHFIVHDITSPISISGIDVVIHCATPDLIDPLHFLKTCSYGAFTAAGIARRNNAKLICISSNKVYGGSDTSNTHEPETDILSPDITSIGINTMESILKNYTTLSVKTLRLYDVYGPKMNKESFIFDSLRRIQKNEDFVIHYNPSSIICSCYVDDVVDAVCCAVEMPQVDSVLNIGSTQTISLVDFLNTAKRISKSDSNIRYIFNADSDIAYMGDKAICDKSFENIKWKQKITYETGISKVLDYIRIGPDREF